MTPEHAARLADLDGDRQLVDATPFGKEWPFVPPHVRRWVLDCCSSALFDTIQERANGNLTDAERKERWKARKARADMYADVRRNQHAMR